MSLYFCYSSALDQESLNRWKLQHGYESFQLPEGKKAVAQDVGLCFDFPSRFWGGRVLGLESKASSTVNGIVFELKSDQDWHIVRHKEGVMTGVCVEFPVEILVDGVKGQATAFATHPSKKSLEGPVSQSFVESLKRAYASWGLGVDLTQFV